MAGRIKPRVSAAVFKFVTIAEDHGKQKDKKFCTEDLWQQIGEANEKLNEQCRHDWIKTFLASDDLPGLKKQTGSEWETRCAELVKLLEQPLNELETQLRRYAANKVASELS